MKILALYLPDLRIYNVKGNNFFKAYISLVLTTMNTHNVTKVNFIFRITKKIETNLKKNSFKILRNCKTLHFEKP